MIEIIRGLVRPIVTVGLVAAAVYLVTLNITVPEWFQVLVASTLAYWFAGRKPQV